MLDTAQGPYHSAVEESSRARWKGRKRREINHLGSLLDHTCPRIPVVMDRCSLSRGLLTGGSAAAQLFLGAPGKNSLKEKVHAPGKAEHTGGLVLHQVSHSSAYQNCRGSFHHLMSNEGHLGRVALSPMAPGAGSGCVWQQSVPAQDNQKGVRACSVLVLKKDR